MKFEFIEFNSRRDMRGAPAARVDVSGAGWLWMTRKDIANNIQKFGSCEALLQAKLAYKNGVDIQLASAACQCATCKPNSIDWGGDQRMIVCSECGNKRCPHATNHIFACTNSNEVGQAGSSWGHVKPVSERTS